MCLTQTALRLRGPDILRLDVISDIALLRALEPEWTSLVERHGTATPFQLPVWLLTWWACFGSGELHVVTIRDHGALQGLLPCFLHEWKGKRQLTLMGSGLSDWTDPPVSFAMHPLLTEHLIAYRDWDLLDWQDLSYDHPLCHLKDVQVRPDVPCSEIPLAGTFEEFWTSRSKDLKRNLRRYSDRAAAAGKMEFHVTDEANRELLDSLVRLHALRWSKQGEAGMISANNSESFLRKAAERFAYLRRLKIFHLNFNDQTAAISLGFLYGTKLFSYLSAFDPQYEILGFGRTLLYNSIQYAYREGYTAWNFLRGEEAYKSSWGAVALPKIRLYKER